MRLITGDKPATLELRLDKAMVDRAINPAQVIGGTLIAALKNGTDIITGSSSITVTIEIGDFDYGTPTD